MWRVKTSEEMKEEYGHAVEPEGIFYTWFTHVAVKIFGKQIDNVAVQHVTHSSHQIPLYLDKGVLQEGRVTSFPYYLDTRDIIEESEIEF